MSALRHRPWLPLLLLVPAPSVGILAALYGAPGPVGQAIFAFSKLWLIAFPLIWTWAVEGDRGMRPRWRVRGYGVGVASGVIMAAIIAAAGLWIGDAWVETAPMRARLADAGLDRPSVYLAGAAYWCLVNALIEEYVWRWFVFRHCRRSLGPAAAVVASAGLFTLHHLLALAAFTGWRVTLLAGTGVFAGGIVWGELRRRFGSVGPGYVSHLLADVGVFVAGWHLLFG